MAGKGWGRRFDDPVPLPGGPPRATLRDAADYILTLPEAEQQTSERQAATEAVILAAEDRGPMMHARIGVLRLGVAKIACARFGYEPKTLEWRIYVGNFAKGHDTAIRDYLLALSPPVRVVGLNDIVGSIIGLATQKTYFDDPVLMTVKALMAAGCISGERADCVVLETEEEE